MAREFSKNRNLKIVLALLIAGFTLINIFLFGYAVSFFKFQQVYAVQENIRYDLLALNLESEFLSECDDFTFATISQELDRAGRDLSLLETRLGKNHPQVLDEKKKYTILEVQHFLNMKKFEETCEVNLNLIMFFYSNEDDFESEANRIGRILSSLKESKPNEVMIYSFDYELDLRMIDLLKNNYNIDSRNTVLVEETTKIQNLKNINEISAIS